MTTGGGRGHHVDMSKPGRPPFYDSPEAFTAAVDRYFAELPERKEPATITGLCLSLGFCDRQSFYDYERKEGFACAVKSARLRVMNEYEKALRIDSKPAGSIFALKNMGWSDRSAVELSGPDGKPLSVVQATMSPEEAAKAYAESLK